MFIQTTTSTQLDEKRAFLLKKVADGFGVPITDQRLKDLSWDLDILIDQFSNYVKHVTRTLTLTEITLTIQAKIDAQAIGE